MTDKEIIKALEYCKDCSANLNVEIIDFINRQQAEIEKLQKNQDDIDNFARCICKERMLKGKSIANFDDLQEYIRREKSEAIKEFTERLKNKIKTECNPYGKPTFDYDTSLAIMRYIDNLVKEMVGEKE